MTIISARTSKSNLLARLRGVLGFCLALAPVAGGCDFAAQDPADPVTGAATPAEYARALTETPATQTATDRAITVADAPARDDDLGDLDDTRADDEGDLGTEQANSGAAGCGWVTTDGGKTYKCVCDEKEVDFGRCTGAVSGGTSIVVD